jgi:DNA-binding XRE family transcriptional regulator
MIGQIVQESQVRRVDKVSKDTNAFAWHYRGMAVWGREQEFNEAFIARVKRLREERGWTSEQMATALGIPAERYRKYEYRTPLPQYLIEPFAIVVDRDVHYLLTGKATETKRAPSSLRRTGTHG